MTPFQRANDRQSPCYGGRRGDSSRELLNELLNELLGQVLDE